MHQNFLFEASQVRFFTRFRRIESSSEVIESSLVNLFSGTFKQLTIFQKTYEFQSQDFLPQKKKTERSSRPQLHLTHVGQLFRPSTLRPGMPLKSSS